jgi:DNA-binding transcriptional LysR family regulator
VDKLSAMEAFVEIVDRGSLTAAADHLGKSLPTMVRTLASLEEKLGVRLLARTTRRMSLTEEGTAYLDRCRRILADVGEAEEMLTRGQAEPRGVLRVTAPVLFGQMHVAPAVTSFLQAYPQVKVELLLLDRVVNLVEEGIDVGVRIARLEDASMIATSVGEMRQVVVASPKLLKKVGVPKRPEALGELPCVQFQGLAAAAVWGFQEDGKSLSVGIDGPMVCNQASAALDACAAGIGFGRFLSYQVAPYLEAKKLRVVLEEFEPPVIPVSVVYAHARLMSPRVRVFVDWMKQRLKNA